MEEGVVSRQTVFLVNLLAPEVMDPLRTVKSKDSKTFMVSFSLKTGVTSYIIRLQNPNRFIRENIVFSSPAEIESLEPYTEYSLSIMSVNSGGQSQPSSSVTAKTGTVVMFVSRIQD